MDYKLNADGLCTANLWDPDAAGRCSTAGGDRTHDRAIMRWKQSVEMVRWREIGPKDADSQSVGVESVRWRRSRMRVIAWDLTIENQ